MQVEHRAHQQHVQGAVGAPGRSQSILQASLAKPLEIFHSGCNGRRIHARTRLGNDSEVRRLGYPPVLRRQIQYGRNDEDAGGKPPDHIDGHASGHPTGQREQHVLAGTLLGLVHSRKYGKPNRTGWGIPAIVTLKRIRNRFKSELQ